MLCLFFAEFNETEEISYCRPRLFQDRMMYSIPQFDVQLIP